MRWARPRLSVRVLMLLVLIVGTALGLWFRLIHDERTGVAAVLRSGGSVYYARDLASSPRWETAPPGWIARRLGLDWFERARYVVLNRGADDATLAGVARLHNLEALEIVAGPKVTDAGMLHLARLGCLKLLNLEQTSVTGKGLRYLVGLRSLRELSLPRQPINDADLAHLLA